MSRGEERPTDAQRNAAAERGNPPMHEQHPLSAREQRLVDAAEALRARGGER
jgi:hypothetical protein